MVTFFDPTDRNMLVEGNAPDHIKLYARKPSQFEDMQKDYAKKKRMALEQRVVYWEKDLNYHEIKLKGKI